MKQISKSMDPNTSRSQMFTSRLWESLTTSIFTTANLHQSKQSRTSAVGTDIRVKKKESSEKKISIEPRERSKEKSKNRRSFTSRAFWNLLKPSLNRATKKIPTWIFCLQFSVYSRKQCCWDFGKVLCSLESSFLFWSWGLSKSKTIKFLIMEGKKKVSQELKL